VVSNEVLTQGEVPAVQRNNNRRQPSSIMT